MNAVAIIGALDLPGRASTDQRVPKKLLLENGAPTAADKRHINDGIEELHWVAALKPTTIGVPEYRDETREYLEISVLHLTLRPGAKVMRLIELVHRAVPYPVLLVTEQATSAGLSAAHKRWSQGEVGRTVLDGTVVAGTWDQVQGGVLEGLLTAFRDALALGRQPRISLLALYQGWIDTLLAFQAARLTGVFAAPSSPEHAAARREALQDCARLETEIARLRGNAAKEKQLARQVTLNLELKRIEAELAAARRRL